MQTDTTWVVLAGGKGTRSANPALPKALQEVRPGTTVMKMLLECIGDQASNVVFALSHGADEVIQELERLQPLFSKLRITWVRDEGLGPVEALLQVREHLTTEFVAVALGDTVVRASLLTYLEQFKRAKKFSAAVVARQSRHLFDSDKVAIGQSGEIEKYAPKGEALSGREGHTWGLTGLLFFRAKALQRIVASSPDVARAAFETFALEEIMAIRTSDYFRDSGTPERLEKIKTELAGSLGHEFGAGSTARPATFVDRDGTLMPDISEGRKTFDSDELFLEAAAFLRSRKALGQKVFLVTNQPGVAKGFIDVDDVYAVHNLLQQALANEEAEFDDFEFCSHHPDKGFPGERTHLKIVCQCRKPEAGMVYELLKRHNVDLETSLVLGDSERDCQLAKRLGIPFVSVEELPKTTRGSR